MSKIFSLFIFLFIVFDVFSLNLTQEIPFSCRYNDEIDLYRDDQLYNTQKLIIGRRRGTIELRQRSQHLIFDFLPHWNLDADEVDLIQLIENIKRGCFKHQVEDFSYPTMGGNRLKFMRYYNSYNTTDYGLGKGWDYLPARITFLSDEKNIILNFEGRERRIYLVKEDDEGIYFQAKKQNIPIVFNKKNQRYFLQSKFNTWTFDNKGNLLVVEDSYHNKITYNYENNQLKEISSALYTVVLHYNDDAHISSISCKDASMQYTYDKNKRLMRKKGSEKDASFQYSYDKNDRLIKIVCSTDEVLKIAYDNTGQVISLTYPSYATISKDAKNRSIETSYSNPTEIFMEYYDKCFRPIKRLNENQMTVDFSYEEKDENLTVHFINHKKQKGLCRYDKYNRLRRFLEFDVRPFKGRVNTEGKDVYTDEPHFLGEFFYYDDNDNLTAWIGEGGGLELYQYNDKNQMSLVYDEGGLRTTCKTVPEVLSESNIYYDLKMKREYAYNQNGYLSLITNGDGKKYKFEYEKHGILIKYFWPDNTWIQKVLDENLQYQKTIIQTGETYPLHSEDTLEMVLRDRILS